MTKPPQKLEEPSKSTEGDRAEAERLAKLAERDRKPSPNPRYEGMTPADAARAIMRPRRPPLTEAV